MKLCCHQEKIVLECDVEYNMDPQKQLETKFVSGDAFGIYSSNLLIDVYQVLISVMIKSNLEEDSILLWDYFKVSKKLVHIIISNKVFSYSLHINGDSF